MNRNILKKYAPQARREFIQAVTDRASYFGLTKKKTEPVTVEGDVAVITGRAFSKKVGEQRKQLEQRVARQGFDQVMEAMAYTWFNRLVAIRFMELHGYLEHGYRVLSHPAGSNTPEILEHADSVDLPGLDAQQVIDLKLAGDKDAELYRMLLIAQCNALHKAMPFLFERIDDETELLLPDNLLHSDSLIRTLVNEIPEDDWQKVEVIGWLYQFYIAEKKDQVIGKVVKSEDIPAATQLFTPNWIVKYLVQNSLGRQWVATYPNSSLKGEMEYYIEPAEQTPEVEEQLKAITPGSLNPEELTLMDPAAGSGHILCEGYDLFKAIYLERGFSKKDIPRLILEKNLYGLEIDDRAAQLASLALMMKARADDRRIFSQGVQPHILSIQESKGLDAKEITEALNAPIMMSELPPSGELFEEIAEEKSPLFSKKNLSVKGDISQADIARLIDLFEHGKTFGSLIRVPEDLAKRLPAIAKRVDDVIGHGGMFERATASWLQTFIRQTQFLALRYDAVVTNPPYMASKFHTPILKEFLNNTFEPFKNDVFSAFMVRCKALTEPHGHLGFMSPFTWMFISSHEELRDVFITYSTVQTLIQLEYSGFDGATVPVCTFTLTNASVLDYTSSFIRLSDFKGPDVQAPKTLEAVANRQCGWLYDCQPRCFVDVPGKPFVYWMPSYYFPLFAECSSLGRRAVKGLDTNGNIDAFLRRWQEVRNDDISLVGGSTWFPLAKGGDFRRWYGNHEFVIDYAAGGERLKGNKANLRNQSKYFKAGLTWTVVSSGGFSVRMLPEGFIFDQGGSAIFLRDDDTFSLLQLLGSLNSRIGTDISSYLCPTLNFTTGDVNKFVISEKDVTDLSRKCVTLAKTDWDLFETSWNFDQFPYVCQHEQSLLSECYCRFAADCDNRRDEMRQLETSINQVLLDAHGLLDKVSADVPEDRISLYRPERKEDIQRLISYSIGCMMGRYSLDTPGLVYANSGNVGFDPSQYQTFPADDDGIIPITEFEWFEDDVSNRVEQFIATAWPEENLEDNLKFVAESIGQKKSESARDAIRRYLCTGFYKHHLSLYKKRPIYWLFSSGKQRAFQCLVYLHRYNAGTLARMRTEYVIPLAGKIDARIEQLAGDIAAASSTSHAKKLTKERDTLIKHSEELQKFDEKLKHYADQRIELDLDDGVKVNYGKFGDLLAEVKAVTGQKAKE